MIGPTCNFIFFFLCRAPSTNIAAYHYLSETLLFNAKKIDFPLNENLDLILNILYKLLVEIGYRFRCFSAGGFVSYLLGKTNKYGDIDIYIELDNYEKENIWHCEDFQKPILEILKSDRIFNSTTRGYYHQASPFGMYNILYSYYAKTNDTVFNFVFLECKNFLSFEELIVDTLDSFDLDICKNSLFLFNHSFRTISFNETEFIGTSYASVSRKIKYMQRRKEFVLNPNKLKLLGLIEIKNWKNISFQIQSCKQK